MFTILYDLDHGAMFGCRNSLATGNIGNHTAIQTLGNPFSRDSKETLVKETLDTKALKINEKQGPKF